jgi:2-iminobutanoate/2-iminopropanoate deaminase
MKYGRLLFHGVFMATACSMAVAQSGPAGKARTEFKNAPEISSSAGYSHAAIVSGGKMVFLAGQVGLNKQGEMIGKGDLRAQAQQVFVNLRAALAAAGATPDDVVKLNYYVVGLNHEKVLVLRDVRDQFINKAHPPVSTLAGVQALFREDAIIEIEAVAVIP